MTNKRYQDFTKATELTLAKIFEKFSLSKVKKCFNKNYDENAMAQAYDETKDFIYENFMLLLKEKQVEQKLGIFGDGEEAEEEESIEGNEQIFKELNENQINSFLKKQIMLNINESEEVEVEKEKQECLTLMHQLKQASLILSQNNAKLQQNEVLPVLNALQ